MPLLEETAGGKILGHDLYLYVRQKATVWGMEEEYICAPVIIVQFAVRKHTGIAGTLFQHQIDLFPVERIPGISDPDKMHFGILFTNFKSGLKKHIRSFSGFQHTAADHHS